MGIGFALVMLVIVVLAELAGGRDSGEEMGIQLAIVLLILISGLLLAKRPDHPISWLMAPTALLGTIAGASADTLTPGMTEMSWWQVPLAIVSGPSWFGLLLTVMILVPLLFPTGSPPTQRWRWVAWLSVGAFLLMTFGWVLQEGSALIGVRMDVWPQSLIR